MKVIHVERLSRDELEAFCRRTGITLFYGLIGWRLMLVVALLSAVPVQAQVGPDAFLREHLRLESEAARHRMDVASTVLVVAAQTLPCLTTKESKKACWANQGVQDGVVVLTSEIVKRLSHRARPNGKDDQSFWSEHTALACVATVRTPWFALCPAVGYARVAADWHWGTDTLAGAGFGAGVALTLHPW